MKLKYIYIFSFELLSLLLISFLYIIYFGENIFPNILHDDSHIFSFFPYFLIYGKTGRNFIDIFIILYYSFSILTIFISHLFYLFCSKNRRKIFLNGEFVYPYIFILVSLFAYFALGFPQKNSDYSGIEENSALGMLIFSTIFPLVHGAWFYLTRDAEN